MILTTEVLSKFELNNVEVDQQGKLRVRWGLFSIFTPTDGYTYVHGFSESFDGITYHYLFERNTTTGNLHIIVANENMVTIATADLPAISSNQVFTHAVVNGEIIISGPNFNCLYGHIGSGLTYAEKVDSINTATTAIDIPTGICSSFGNRVAIAQNDVIYFSDPDAIQTYVAQNALHLPGHIYSLNEVSAGLLIATTDGTYLIPKDALSQGQEVFGFLQKISPFAPHQYQSVVNTPTGPLGIKRGIYKISDILVPMDTNSYSGRRFASPRLEQNSFEFSRTYPHPNGACIALDGYIINVNTINNTVSWISHQSEGLNLMGILNGGLWPMYILDERIVYPRDGVDEDFYRPVTGYLCGAIPAADKEIIITSVTTTANNDDLNHSVYLKGQRSLIENDRGSATLDFDASEEGTAYSEIEIQSVKHRFRVRTVHPQIEIAIDGAGSEIGPIEIITKLPIGSTRGQS
jgi:hypothetical protein